MGNGEGAFRSEAESLEALILMLCCAGVKNRAFGKLNMDKHDGQDRELKEGLIAKSVTGFDLDFIDKLNEGHVKPDSVQDNRLAYGQTQV
jgi:hypothetical protein